VEFSQAVLKVERLAECVRFYRDLLGCELVGGDAAGPVAYFASAGGRFALLDAKVAAALVPGGDASPGAPRVTFAFRADDVDAAHRRLAEAGVRYTLPPADFAAWGVRSSLCEDPDGNPVEIFAPLPGAAPTEGAPKR
jgi:catechol 2,3-dioxygenase-like lactoylglutathione lyase family enzyme